MGGNPQVLRLLEEMLDSGKTPEEVCRDCPELLAEVHQRWQEFCRIDAQLRTLLPGLATRPDLGVDALEFLPPLADFRQQLGAVAAHLFRRLTRVEHLLKESEHLGVAGHRPSSSSGMGVARRRGLSRRGRAKVGQSLGQQEPGTIHAPLQNKAATVNLAALLSTCPSQEECGTGSGQGPLPHRAGRGLLTRPTIPWGSPPVHPLEVQRMTTTPASNPARTGFPLRDLLMFVPDRPSPLSQGVAHDH